MPPCDPDHVSSESTPVIGVPVVTSVWPLALERRVYHKGRGLASHLYKRGEDRFDYCLDLRQGLEPGETIIGASSMFRSATVPTLAITAVQYGSHHVVIWIDGGKDGQTYRISVVVLTSMGRVLTFRFFITVCGDAPTYTATIIGDDDAEVCSFPVPEITFSPASPAFPPTPVGFISDPVIVTVTNTGQTRINIHDIAVAQQFSFTSDTSGVLDPADYFTLQLRFQPAHAGLSGGFAIVAGTISAQLILLAEGL